MDRIKMGVPSRTNSFKTASKYYMANLQKAEGSMSI